MIINKVYINEKQKIKDEYKQINMRNLILININRNILVLHFNHKNKYIIKLKNKIKI